MTSELKVIGNFRKGYKRGLVRVELIPDKFWFSSLDRQFMDLLISKAKVEVKDVTYDPRVMFLVRVNSMNELRRMTNPTEDQFLREIKFIFARAERNLRFTYPFIWDEIVDNDIAGWVTEIDDKTIRFTYGELSIFDRSQNDLTFHLDINEEIVGRFDGRIQGVFDRGIILMENEDDTYTFTLPRPAVKTVTDQEYLHMVGELLAYELSEALNEVVEREEREEREAHPQYAHLGREERKKAIAFDQELEDNYWASQNDW